MAYPLYISVCMYVVRPGSSSGSVMSLGGALSIRGLTGSISSTQFTSNYNTLKAADQG